MRLIKLFEAPIGDFGTIGDFSDDNASMAHASDRRAVTAAPMVKRIKQAWERTPFDFNLFFANVPGMEKYVEQGYVSDMTVQREFPEMAERILAGKDSQAITVVFTNNKGDERISLTPWIIAHRISHALIRPNNARDPRQGMQNPAFRKANDQALDLFRSGFADNASRMGLNLKGIPEEGENSPMRNYFQMIGTMKSARSGAIPRAGEFPHEVFAQYLLQGSIQFNRVDAAFMQQYATNIGVDPSRLNISNSVLESINEDLSYYEQALAKNYSAGLEAAQGRVIFM